MKYIFLLAFCTISFSGILNAQNNLKSKNYNINKNLALSGYDPVSYFDGKPKKGSEKITYNFDGINYRFVSEDNKNKFIKNPSSYEPQYGGWCAYAMGNTGEKVEVDPETYKIVGGKLYLFYNKLFNNTLNSWNKNEKGLKDKADLNWQKIYH